MIFTGFNDNGFDYKLQEHLNIFNLLELKELEL